MRLYFFHCSMKVKELEMRLQDEELFQGLQRPQWLHSKRRVGQLK
jgi:hypothetical protein